MTDTVHETYLHNVRQLVEAVMASDLDGVATLLAAGVNPNMGIFGIPLLSYAALFGTDYTVIGHLIAYGADPLRRCTDITDRGVKLPGELCADEFTRQIFVAAEEQIVDKVFCDPDYEANPFDDFSAAEIPYDFTIAGGFRQNSWDVLQYGFMPAIDLNPDNAQQTLPHLSAN